MNRKKMASSWGGDLRMSVMAGQLSYDSSAQQSRMAGPLEAQGYSFL